MKAHSKKLLLGVVVGVLAWCVVAASGDVGSELGGAELPPAAPVPEERKDGPSPTVSSTASSRTVSRPPINRNVSRSDVIRNFNRTAINRNVSRPTVNRNINRMAVSRTRLVSMTAIPDSASSLKEPITKMVTTATSSASTTPPPPSTTPSTIPSTTPSTSPSTTPSTPPTPSTISTTPSPSTTTKSTSSQTSSPYSIYDMRYYMDEESLARESSSASASRQFPSYGINTRAWRQYTFELTTPSVPYFDKMHSELVTNIEHNIDQVLNMHKRMDMDLSDNATDKESNTATEREEFTFEPSNYLTSKPSDVRLDFSNRVEIIYNGTKGPASIKGDLVVINGTHLDLEINRTTVYPMEDFSTIRYYEQTTPRPQEVHQSLQSENSEVIIHHVTTTDIPTTYIPTTDIPTTNSPTTEIPTTNIPTTDIHTTNIPTTDIRGTTDATTNNPRSRVDNSFSADSVQSEITTVSPGEINSTTNDIFIIPETTNLELTTELPEVVSTTDASISLRVISRIPTNAPSIPFTTQKVTEPESIENVDINIITTTLASEPSLVTSRRPPWVPHKSEATTTELPETNDVPSPRSSRGRMMPLNTSSANRLGTSDTEGSGSFMEVLTTVSPEENAVYPLQRSSSPTLLLDGRNVSSTRRKVYIFKNTHTTKITTPPSTILPSTSPKSTEDNIITVERSPTLNAGLELTNGSARNNERNDISNIYNFPPVTSRGTIRYTSKAANFTNEATTVSSTGAVWTMTALKSRSQRLRTPMNTSTTPAVDDEQETSYVRVPTVEKPKNSSQRPIGIQANRTTTRLQFTPLGPTRIRTVAEDDRNSSEWPNSFSKIYIFPSTMFPPSYNAIDHVRQGTEGITQNHSSVEADIPDYQSSTKFTVADQTSAEEVTTEVTTTLLPDTTTIDTESELQSQTTSSSPSTSTKTFQTIFFPTMRTFPATTTFATTEHVTHPIVTWSSTLKTVSSSPRLITTSEVDEATESVDTTTHVAEDNLSQANSTAVPSFNDTRTSVALESTSSAVDLLPGAAVHNGTMAGNTRLNGSKQEDELQQAGARLTEETPHHSDGNQLHDIGHHPRDWNHRGPNRVDAVHEDTLAPLDDLNYGGGGDGGNDLGTTAVNTTSVDMTSTTVKKGKVTSSPPTTVMNTTIPSTTSTSAEPTEKVTAYLLLLTDASWYDVCQSSDTFRTSVATLLSQASNTTVKSQQVILLNISPALCSEVLLKTDASEKQLVPIEFYVTNSDNVFDLQMCQQFRDAWKDHQLQYPYPVRSVELVFTTLISNKTAIVSEDNSAGTIAAIVISCVGIVSLVLLAVLVFILMRKRQKKFNYGQRCTPVSLDAYSLDSVSVCNSVRRKAARASKRSYGNPAFDDPNAPSHPMNFAGLANFSSDVAALEEEFNIIPQLSPKVDEVPQGAEAKNRYANVIPLPETRVTLTPVESEPLSEYINANYVRGPKGVEKFYIACQAPLQTTITDFWRMVWEHQSKVILMLTDLVEDGKEKCADYLPPSEVTDCHRLFGDFQITLKKREVKDKYIISTLQIKNLETNLWREVTHLWYLGWPAQGVPEEATSLIAFLIEARSYTRGNTGPIVAHCSPGTGRTGTVLACDLCIREFEQTRMVDIPRCVSRLRRDRAGAVQTKEQYVFIYQVLNLYATKLTGGALDSL